MFQDVLYDKLKKITFYGINQNLQWVEHRNFYLQNFQEITSFCSFVGLAIEKNMSKTKTLFDKVWDSHVVHQIKNGPDVLFIDRHLVHEVTSPVAFLGLKSRNISVMHPEKNICNCRS